MNVRSQKPETVRLEELWAGQFGDAYVDRNANTAVGRMPFWQQLFARCPAQSVLEVGCNIGANLESITRIVPPSQVFGIDVNDKALEQLRGRLPGVNGIWSVARDLPFRDRRFDLVFTTGVLIHQPPEQLPLVMAEIVRCSNNYVLCGEYYSEEPTEIPYRGETGALFKRDFGSLYRQLFPELELLWQEFYGKEQGWDDVTFWMFRRTR